MKTDHHKWRREHLEINKASMTNNDHKGSHNWSTGAEKIDGNGFFKPTQGTANGRGLEDLGIDQRGLRANLSGFKRDFLDRV